MVVLGLWVKSLFKEKVYELAEFKAKNEQLASDNLALHMQNAKLQAELQAQKEDIVLVHEPPVDALDEIVEYSPTIVFSGHTHNGQF